MAYTPAVIVQPKKRKYGVVPDFPDKVDANIPLPGREHGIIGRRSLPHTQYDNKGFLVSLYGNNQGVPYSSQSKFTEVDVLAGFGQAWDTIPFDQFPARAQQLANSFMATNPYRLHMMSTDEGNLSNGWPGIVPFFGGNHNAASYHMHRAFGIAAKALPEPVIYGGNYGGMVYMNNPQWSNPEQYRAGLTNSATALSELQNARRWRNETFWLNNDLHQHMACPVNGYVGPGVSQGLAQGFLACTIVNLQYAINGREAKGGNFPILHFRWPSPSEFDRYAHRNVVQLASGAKIVNYTFPLAPPNLTYSQALFATAMVEKSFAWNDGIWTGSDEDYPPDDLTNGTGFPLRRLEGGTTLQQQQRLPLSRVHDGGTPRAFFESKYGFDDWEVEGIIAASKVGRWAGSGQFRSAATRQVGSNQITAAGKDQVIDAMSNRVGLSLITGNESQPGGVFHNFSTQPKEVEVQLGSSLWTVIQAAPETSYAFICKP